ncbi:ABC transporter permease [Streptomyces beihaiensis]|uniref:ABC transporter permease n=1 Tax=Streptomyces beihaiensis TaxID=2984495 RepID=A0ABT3TTN6_9ACTN|nr:ABC transporter permease [Streptomyces beihaiensis]MCX3060397.1 ABC transporter permease [Streptomyces beihaiensis]
MVNRRRVPGRAAPGSRLALRDLLSEAVAGVVQRPARSVLTSLGTVLGVGSFIAVLGLTGTAAAQIDTRFNRLTVTEVTVEDTGGQDADRVPLSFPRDADRRMDRVHGVTAAGVYWKVRLAPGTAIRSSPVAAPDGAVSRTPVVAASPGLLDAAAPHFTQGRAFDAFHDTHDQRVAVIGSATAARLGITTLRTQPAIFIGDTPFTVIGVFDDVRRKPDLLLDVIVPRTPAERIWGPPQDERAKMLISTRLGAAPQVASQAALALRPDHPDYLRAVPPPDPKALRHAVGGDLGQLFLLLAVVCLFIGAVGIANTTLVAVMERVGEIGLRRALGARARHITWQFLTESAALGLLGGIAGTSLGTAVVVGVCLHNEWTPVLDPLTLGAAPVLGLATGLLAGLYPSWRASCVQPVEALRR